VSSPLRFGTDGWRAVIGFEFTGQNLLRVINAIHQWLEEAGEEGELVVGYDNRFNAELFAELTARRLSQLGWEVVLADRPTPTPVIAYTVMEREMAGGLMLTASHNQPHWLGLKLIPRGGVPAPSDTTARIEELIAEQRPDPDLVGRLISDPEPLRREDLSPPYLAHLERLIDFGAISELTQPIYLNYQHGAAIGWVAPLMAKHGIEVVELREDPDPLFGGCQPDPTRENLLADWADNQIEQGIMVAFDGDGDRVGILEDGTLYLTGNELIPLMGDFLLSRGQDGPLARNVATSHLVDRVSEAHGHRVMETKVGFKYLGPALLRGAVVAGEESGGISAREHVPDKDGIYSALRSLEAAARHGSFHLAMVRLWESYGESHAGRRDYRLAPEKKELCYRRLATLSSGEQFLGRRISAVNRLDGIKLIFGETTWICFRASGTEPVLRVYAEAETMGELEALQREAGGFIADL